MQEDQKVPGKKSKGLEETNVKGLAAQCVSGNNT